MVYKTTRTYKATLLSPVIVQDLPEFPLPVDAFLQDKDGVIGPIDPKKFLDVLTEIGVETRKRFFDLFAAKPDRTVDSYVNMRPEFFKDELTIYRYPTPAKVSKEIYTIFKNPVTSVPYIPGSSVKGALGIASLFHFIHSDITLKMAFQKTARERLLPYYYIDRKRMDAALRKEKAFTGQQKKIVKAMMDLFYRNRWEKPLTVEALLGCIPEHIKNDDCWQRILPVINTHIRKTDLPAPERLLNEAGSHLIDQLTTDLKKKISGTEEDDLKRMVNALSGLPEPGDLEFEDVDVPHLTKVRQYKMGPTGKLETGFSAFSEMTPGGVSTLFSLTAVDPDDLLKQTQLFFSRLWQKEQTFFSTTKDCTFYDEHKSGEDTYLIRIGRYTGMSAKTLLSALDDKTGKNLMRAVTSVKKNLKRSYYNGYDVFFPKTRWLATDRDNVSRPPGWVRLEPL